MELDIELDWGAAEQPSNKGVQRLIRDLNQLYCDTPALHVKDCEHDGFSWLSNDPAQSTICYARFGLKSDAPVVVACNFTPVERQGFRIGVPKAGFWAEVLNTDATIYGGENRGNVGGCTAQNTGADGHDHSVTVTLPPLSVVVFRHQNED